MEHKTKTENRALFVDVLEDVLEAAVVALQDRVLRAHKQRPPLLERELEARVRERGDRLVRVEHAERHAGTRKAVHRIALRLHVCKQRLTIRVHYVRVYAQQYVSSRLPVYEMISAAAELLTDLTSDMVNLSSSILDW